jgi:hypothetical protein
LRLWVPVTALKKRKVKENKKLGLNFEKYLKNLNAC